MKYWRAIQFGYGYYGMVHTTEKPLGGCGYLLIGKMSPRGGHASGKKKGAFMIGDDGIDNNGCGRR